MQSAHEGHWEWGNDWRACTAAHTLTYSEAMKRKLWYYRLCKCCSALVRWQWPAHFFFARWSKFRWQTSRPNLETMGPARKMRSSLANAIGTRDCPESVAQPLRRTGGMRGCISRESIARFSPPMTELGKKRELANGLYPKEPGRIYVGRKPEPY